MDEENVKVVKSVKGVKDVKLAKDAEVVEGTEERMHPGVPPQREWLNNRLSKAMQAECVAREAALWNSALCSAIGTPAQDIAKGMLLLQPPSTVCRGRRMSRVQYAAQLSDESEGDDDEARVYDKVLVTGPISSKEWSKWFDEQHRGGHRNK
jgi:hypothetical protein